MENTQDPFENYCRNHVIGAALQVELHKIYNEQGMGGVRNALRLLGDQEEKYNDKEDYRGLTLEYNHYAERINLISDISSDMAKTIRTIARYLRMGSKEREGD